MPSNDTTPPPEDEAPPELPTIKGNEEALFIRPTTLSHESAISDEQAFTRAQMPPIETTSVDLADEVEPISSACLKPEDDTFVSNVETGPRATASSENFTFTTDAAEPVLSGETFELHDTDTMVSSNTINSMAVESTALQTNLKLKAESHQHEPAPALNVNDEERHKSADVEAQGKTPSVAISCSSTVSAIDPPSTRLRHMIAKSPSIITCPGVYDGLSARIALHVGFKAMYMTGAGTTASCLGASDLGIAHLHDMRTNAEMIANLQPDGPPLIADMDTGYGGPLIISRAVKQYARAGVAAFHIEDQVPEKRCGHLAGKEVVDVDTYLRRIRACLDARTQIRSDIIIIARTDALQSRGYDDCIERLRRARDLGADMGILEGVSSKDMAAQAVKDLAPWPLCYNSVENGHSPLITADEAQAMGYRLMVFSFAGIAPAYMAIMETFTKLKEQGVTGSIVGPKKIFEVCGLEEEIRIDGAAGSSMLAKGV